MKGKNLFRFLGIHMKIKQVAKKIIYFLMVYMMVINCICEMFNVPNIVRYLSDILVAILLLFIVINIRKLFTKKEIKLTISIFLCFIFFSFCGFIFNFYSPFLYFWGLRNICRFFIVFFAVVLFFDINDNKNIYKIYNIIFIINIMLSLYQFFILGYWADELGGTFRINNKGGNSGLLFLLIIENIYVFSDFLNKKISFLKLVLVIMSSMIVAAFAELKAFYVIFVAIILLSLLLNNKSVKTIFIAIISVLVLYIGVLVLGEIAPKSVKILNVDGITQYISGNDHGYSSKDDISRGRAFAQINEKFFDETPINKLFGYGLGNCDVSGFDVFRSSFYEQYKDLNYTWFMHSMLYLETGYIGYVLYVLFLVSCCYSFFKFKKMNPDNASVYISGLILAFICILMTWYNAALRNDVSFFIYISLALPFVTYEQSKNKKVIDQNKKDICI